MITRSRVTLEYVRVSVTETGGQPIASTTVQLALVPGRVPTEQDWHSGVWQTEPGPSRTAAILVGPGGTLELPPGRYDVWYRFDDTPERPARVAGRLAIV